MNTYLLTWNPIHFPYHELEDEIKHIHKYGVMNSYWSCGNRKNIVAGDRLFFLRQGSKTRGIYASGWATSSVFEDIPFNSSSAKSKILYVQTCVDVLLNTEKEPIFPRAKLEVGRFSSATHMHWDTQVSGVIIPPDVATVLEEEWDEFLAGTNQLQGDAKSFAYQSPDEVDMGQNYYEGTAKFV